MKRNLLTTVLTSLFILICTPLSLFAQTGIIKGTITDEFTKEALANVNITLDGTTFGSASAKSGEYEIANIPPGKYSLIVSRIGYKIEKKEIEITAGATQTLNIGLQIQAIELSRVIVSRVMLTGGENQIAPIPGAVHYIGPREMAQNNHYDIHQVLRDIPGVNIQEEDGYGLRPNIGLRGTGVDRSQKITLMEDGILTAPAPYSAPAAYYFPTVGRMHSVEVRKGSSQIKYGPFTTGGALNMISTPIPTEFHGSTDFFAGANDARNLHVIVGDSYKNYGFLIETYQMNVDGFKNLDGGGDTGFDKKDYLAKLRLNTHKNARHYQALTLKIGQVTELSNETYLGLTDADYAKTPYRRYSASQMDLMDAEQKQFQLRHFIQINSSLDFTTTIYRNEFKRNWFKLDRVMIESEGSPVSISKILEDPEFYFNEFAILTGSNSLNDNALEVKNNNRKYYSQGIQSVAGYQFNRLGAVHDLEFGIRYHGDQMDRFQWVDMFAMDNGTMKLTTPGIPGTESNRIESAKALALYLQYRLTSGKWTFLPGMRYEDITLKRLDYGNTDPERSATDLKERENKINIVIPGIGINYRISSSLTSFFGIHRGFAPPGSKEGAKPEESINYELGFRLNTGKLSIHSTLFFNDYDNLLGSDLAASGGRGTTDLFNGGKVKVKGLEFMVDTDLGNSNTKYSIPFRLSYTYTNAKFNNDFVSDYEPWRTVSTGDELPYLPNHQFAASLGLAAKLWQLKLSAKHTGSMRTKAGSGELLDSESIKSHLVLDLVAEYSITSTNRLFIGIRNLTNQKYIAARRPAGIRPGLPRTFMGGIKTSF